MLTVINKNKLYLYTKNYTHKQTL